MPFNRKFKRKHPNMRKLIFPSETYLIKPIKDVTGKDTDKNRLILEKGLIGLLELLNAGIENSPCQELSKKEHKINKKLKQSLEKVTQFKDEDEDARVTREGEQALILDEDEYELMKKLLDANKFSSKISSQVSDLWDIIDGAETYKPEFPVQQTPALVK